jgi:hypothetical protein
MLCIEAFSTVYRDNPDYNAADELTEAQQLLQRQQMIGKFIKGEVDPDTLLDLLESQGFDPVEYVKQVEVNAAAIIADGAIPHDINSLIIPDVTDPATWELF